MVGRSPEGRSRCASGGAQYCRTALQNPNKKQTPSTTTRPVPGRRPTTHASDTLVATPNLVACDEEGMALSGGV